MSDTTPILRLLQQVRRRGRQNQLAQVAVHWATHALAIIAAVALWNLLMPLSWALPWWLTVAALGMITAVHIRRIWRAEPLWTAAVRADGAADLHDELTSAFWFLRNPENDEWVDLHVDRAVERAQTLDPAQLVPSRRPDRTALPAALAALLLLLWLLPVPRVFEGLDQRLADLDLAELVLPADEEPVAELEELGDRGPETELLAEAAFPDEEEELAAQLEEQQQEGQDGLAEEEGTEEGEEGQSEESMMEGDEQGEQGEGEQSEGQQMEAQDPEDMPADAEREASPDPSASQQDGEGDSTEESGAMLPGGEEVFLQEGGEDLEQSEMAEEELGHATREGGGEQELEEGALETLEVQLQREILAVPEEQPEIESEEEKEELVTKAESSLLDFQNVTPEEFAVQELLQSEAIPWRYRQLVLEYFKTLRERDNRPKEQVPQ